MPPPTPLLPLLLLLLVAASALASNETTEEFDQSFYKQVYPAVEDAMPGTDSLYLALVVSFGGIYTSSGVVPGVQVALDQINEDPSMLPGYTLHYTLRDSQCERRTGLDSLFAEIVQEPTKIAVMGAGCSVATEATAEVSHYYNITQMSCVSSSDELFNRETFRSYFQFLGRDGDQQFGFFQTIMQFNWTRVAIFTQNENLFTVTMNGLIGMLRANGVIADEKLFETNEGVTSLGEDIFVFNDPEPRIFISAMYPSEAVHLMCEAHKRNLLYPRHVFLVYGWYDEEWWVGSPDVDYNCTVADRESVAAFSLGPAYAEFSDPLRNQVSDAGFTGEDFFEAYKDHLESNPLNLTRFVYSQSCYEATWTLAYALNNTLTEIASDPELSDRLSAVSGLEGGQGGTFRLSDFTYSSDDLRNVIFRHLTETNITGITGPISFEPSGTSRHVEIINLLQHRYSTDAESGERILNWPVKIGNIVEVSESDGAGGQRTFEFVFIDGQEEIVWLNENGDFIVPYDGVPIPSLVHVNLGMAIFFYILATAGVVFAIVCLVFNFACRNQRLIRLSSPNLNYLIGAGAIILYIDVCFFVIPSIDRSVITATCNLTPWLTAIGYSLCYGTMVVKMCRIYYIFNDPSLRKHTVKDWHLSVAVLLMVLIDLTILITYTVVEGVRGNLEAVEIPHRENPVDINGEVEFIHEFYTYICDSQARDIFLGVLYGYKAALQIVALVLSFGIRKVKVKGLDDSKYIAAAVYVTSIVLAVVIVATYTLDEFINGYAAVFCTGFSIGTTVILCIVFIPKMVGLYKDPKGEHVFAKTQQQQQQHTSSGAISGQPAGVKPAVLLARVSMDIDSNINYSSMNSDSEKDRELEMLRERVKQLEGRLSEQDPRKVAFANITLTSEETTFTNGVALKKLSQSSDYHTST